MEPILDHFWGHFGVRFGPRLGPRGAKMGPRGVIERSKIRKSGYSKVWFLIGRCALFEVLDAPKTAPRGPRGCPRASKRAPKPQKKWFHFWSRFLLIFGPLLAPFWRRFGLQNQLKIGAKNGITFLPKIQPKMAPWNPPRPCRQPSGLPRHPCGASTDRVENVHGA